MDSHQSTDLPEDQWADDPAGLHYVFKPISSPGIELNEPRHIAYAILLQGVTQLWRAHKREETLTYLPGLVLPENSLGLNPWPTPQPISPAAYFLLKVLQNGKSELGWEPAYADIVAGWSIMEEQSQRLNFRDCLDHFYSTLKGPMVLPSDPMCSVLFEAQHELIERGLMTRDSAGAYHLTHPEYWF